MRKTTWDVFVSHAYEDKDGFVRELANELRSSGVRVWYDEFTLTAGDSLRESIDRGIADAHIGVVVLSKHFFRKNWARHELNGIFSLSVNEGRRLIPVWLDVTVEEVGHYSPMLVDRVAARADDGVAPVVAHILAALWGEKAGQLNRQMYVYKVNISDQHHHLLSPVGHEMGFAHGLSTEAVFGALRKPITGHSAGSDLTPGNFLENYYFVTFLHRLIAKEIYRNALARKKAADQRTGYLYLIDGRAPDPQDVAPEDILGSVELNAGDMVPDSYQRNRNHRLFTWNGLFVLPNDIEYRMMSEIYRTVEQETGGEMFMVNLEGPL